MMASLRLQKNSDGTRFEFVSPTTRQHFLTISRYQKVVHDKNFKNRKSVRIKRDYFWLGMKIRASISLALEGPNKGER